MFKEEFRFLITDSVKAYFVISNSAVGKTNNNNLSFKAFELGLSRYSY